MIVRSLALTRLPHGSLISLVPRFSAMSRTIRPRDLSWSLTACLESASTSPLLWTPTRSIALKTNVLLMALRGVQRQPQQAAQLLGGGGPRLGELRADVPGAHELCERGVHRLHALVG